MTEDAANRDDSWIAASIRVVLLFVAWAAIIFGIVWITHIPFVSTVEEATRQPSVLWGFLAVVAGIFLRYFTARMVVRHRGPSVSRANIQ